MSDALLAPLILTIFVALCVLVLLKPLLQKAGVLDIPNERSSHEFPVVRGGGLAQAAGLMIGLGAAIALIDAIERPELMVLLAVSLATASLGWVEDYSGAPISVRASVQFAIGFVAIGVFAALDGRPIAWAVIGGIAFVGLINVVNFMDGINGISAFHAIVAGTTFAALGALNDLNWMIIAGSLLAAAYAAFLPWNLSGRMFLGDVGSYLLGGSIAGIIVLGWMGGVPLIALAAPMTIYLSDTGVTLVGICQVK